MITSIKSNRHFAVRLSFVVFAFALIAAFTLERLDRVTILHSERCLRLAITPLFGKGCVYELWDTVRVLASPRAVASEVLRAISAIREGEYDAPIRRGGKRAPLRR